MDELTIGGMLNIIKVADQYLAGELTAPERALCESVDIVGCAALFRPHVDRFVREESDAIFATIGPM